MSGRWVVLSFGSAPEQTAKAILDGLQKAYNDEQIASGLTSEAIAADRERE